MEVVGGMMMMDMGEVVGLVEGMGEEAVGLEEVEGEDMAVVGEAMEGGDGERGGRL